MNITTVIIRRGPAGVNGTNGAIGPAAALTYAGVNPNFPETLTVTGVLVGDSFTFTVPAIMTRAADVDGFPAWEGGDSSTMQKVGSLLEFQFGGNDYVATHAIPTPFNPAGLTGWTVTTGAGQPVITGDAPIATYLGQWCKASTAWWQWSGTLWQPIRLLTGEPITTDGTDYFAITHDGSSLGYTSFP